MCSFGSCQTRFEFLSQFRKVRNAFECFVTQVQTRLPKTKCVWPMKINVICTVSDKHCNPSLKEQATPAIFVFAFDAFHPLHIASKTTNVIPGNVMRANKSILCAVAAYIPKLCSLSWVLMCIMHASICAEKTPLFAEPRENISHILSSQDKNPICSI